MLNLVHYDLFYRFTRILVSTFLKSNKIQYYFVVDDALKRVMYSWEMFIVVKRPIHQKQPINSTAEIPL